MKHLPVHPDDAVDEKGFALRPSAGERNKIEKARDAATDRRRKSARDAERAVGIVPVNPAPAIKAEREARETATALSHPIPGAAKSAADALHQVAAKLSSVKAKAKTKAKSFGDTWTAPSDQK